MDENTLNKYECVVGLEIHVQLKTASKIFAADRNEYGTAPNSNVSVVSIGHPGTLPKLNKKVIDYAIRLGLACESEITRNIHFARKNYFYADLPKGYQITQDETPICKGGRIIIQDEHGAEKSIQLTRIHMEEDAGKSLHDQDPYDTLIDLNRAGVPLLEIVSEPDIRSAKQAYNYLAEVRRLVRYLDICDGNMEEGSMRCDANISVRKKGDKQLGTRTEVKNMNSLRNVQRAIEHEVERQIALVEKGDNIHQETRSYDAISNTTFSLRSKELAHDYRYFPEPDLQPVQILEKEIEETRNTLPPLPRQLLKKYQDELGLSSYDAQNLIEDKAIALYFEELIQHTSNYKSAANWIMGEVKSYLNERALKIADFPLKPAKIAALIALIDEGKISNSIAAQSLFPKLLENPDANPGELAQAENLTQESDEETLLSFVHQAIAQYPDKVQEYKAGKKGLLGMFMGEVMKLSKGKADPKTANQLVKKILDE